MTKNENHLSDRELLVFIDGETSPERAERARRHLDLCDPCRQRRRKFEQTMARFITLHQEDMEARLSSGANSRMALKARMAEASAKPRSSIEWLRSWSHIELEASWAVVCAAIVLAAIGIGGMYLETRLAKPEARIASSAAAPVPKMSLTPGAIRPVTRNEVCRVPRNDEEHAISTDLQRRVFQEYGMPNAKPTDYEVDYLITPELGGANDIRNLWPEPHSATEWNSYVKDDLEERLRQMVCQGQIDLPTAQREISTDWIAAYKKYFHTSKPLPGAPRFAPQAGAEPNG